MKQKYTYTVGYNTIAVAGSLVLGGTVFLSIWNYLDKNVPEFRFEDTGMLWFLLVLPVLAAGFIFYQVWQNRTLQQIGDKRLLQTIMPGISNAASVARFILIQNALFLLIIAFANPQYGSSEVTGKQKGAELMIALDISNSMMAEDQGGGMNRLTAAKLAINQLVPQLKGDKIGVVIFAGDAYVQVPMTNDYSALKMFLNPITPDYISKQGTAIGQAIATSAVSFTKNFKGSKAIIVISDGENHEDDAIEQAKQATSQGITVHTIGVGDKRGSPIPLYVDGEKQGLRRDQLGNTVITRINEAMLADVAQAGNGVYIKATQTRFGLETLLERIYKMQKTEMGTTGYNAYDDQFMPFLFGAFVLLLAEMLIFPWNKRRKMVFTT
jgi:Ca-activated chloride channel homolog